MCTPEAKTRSYWFTGLIDIAVRCASNASSRRFRPKSTVASNPHARVVVDHRIHSHQTPAANDAAVQNRAVPDVTILLHQGIGAGESFPLLPQLHHSWLVDCVRNWLALLHVGDAFGECTDQR